MLIGVCSCLECSAIVHAAFYGDREPTLLNPSENEMKDLDQELGPIWRLNQGLHGIGEFHRCPVVALEKTAPIQFPRLEVAS